MIECYIQCFGALREINDQGVIIHKTNFPCTVADIKEELSSVVPEAFRGLLKVCALSQGDRLMNEQDQLVSGDELSLLPPVNGG